MAISSDLSVQGKLLKNPDSGTRTECLVAISPHYGPAGDSHVGGLGQTQQVITIVFGQPLGGALLTECMPSLAEWRLS